MTPAQAWVVAALGLLQGCGSAGATRPIQPRHAVLALPPASVQSTADTATLVVMFPSAPDPRRSLIVAEARSRRFLTELAPYSYSVVQLAPGPIELLAGSRETGAICALLEGEVEAGKVYAAAVGSYVDFAGISSQPLDAEAEAARISKQLSLFSYFEGGASTGKAALAQDWGPYWQPCISEARASRAKAMATSLGQTEEYRRASRVRPERGTVSLTIPAPP